MNLDNIKGYILVLPPQGPKSHISISSMTPKQEFAPLSAASAQVNDTVL